MTAITLEQAVEVLLAHLPKHDCELILTHNEHKSYYQTVKQMVEVDDRYWISDEEKQKAIETNECWTLQWYPHTPIGFHIASASNLTSLLTDVHASETKGTSHDT